MIRLLSLLLLLGLPLTVMAYNGDYIWEDKFKKALPKAQNGDVEAQYDLGAMYERGRGTNKDSKKAFEWYSKAAQQGNVKASYKVGVGYLKGKGVNQDPEKAMKWLKISSNKGYARAHYYMGEIYEKGIGVDTDYDEAIKWYKKSKAGGYRPAKERIAIVVEKQKDMKAEEAERAARAKRRAKAAAAANARRRLSENPAKSTKVSRKSPAESPPTTDEILLKGGWNKRNKPAEYLPSSATKCKKRNDTIECLSKGINRNIGMADINYETKAIIYSIENTGEFKVSYRNNVTRITVTDPEFIESGADVPVKKGWQDAEHKLECTVENESSIVCKKDRLRKLKFRR